MPPKAARGRPPKRPHPETKAPKKEPHSKKPRTEKDTLPKSAIAAQVSLDKRFSQYPRKFLKAVDAAHAASVNSPPSHSVYVLVNESPSAHDTGRFALCGAYSSVQKANVRALNVFLQQYGDYLPVPREEEYEFVDCSKYSDEQILNDDIRTESRCIWKINREGCLLLQARDTGLGSVFKVYAERMSLDSDHVKPTEDDYYDDDDDETEDADEDDDGY